MNVEIWGLYPPPLGGVSIHIMRLMHQLNLYEYVLLKDFKPKDSYSYGYIFPVKYPIFEAIKLFFLKKRIIHVEQFSLLIFIAILVLGRKHVVGITLHNQRSISIKHPLKKKKCEYFFKKCAFIIMNDNKFSKIFSLYYHVSPDKIHILPAFLPPGVDERKGLPDNVLRFKKKHDYLLSANAFRLRKENGIDVYGLDMLVSLTEHLRKKGVNTGLVFLLPERGDNEYYNEITDSIRHRGLTEHILFVEGFNDNGFEYWAISDLFIRPTITDMEGVSVKEALTYGTNVLASDVCIRPKECLLFENRNQEDLFNKAYGFYLVNGYKNKIKYKSHIDVALETLKIYKSLE